MTAQASLPTTLVVDRTLGVSHARRIETPPRRAAAARARLRLLTSRTNLLVVHERAEGEKAKDLPELAQVAQMHAAGGMGWVGARIASNARPCLHDCANGDISFDRVTSRHVVQSRECRCSGGYALASMARRRAANRDLDCTRQRHGSRVSWRQSTTSAGCDPRSLTTWRAWDCQGISWTSSARGSPRATPKPTWCERSTRRWRSWSPTAPSVRRSHDSSFAWCAAIRPADECRELRDGVLKLVRDACAQSREVRLGM